MSNKTTRKNNSYNDKNKMSNSLKVNIDIRNANVTIFKDSEDVYSKKFRGCGINAIYCEMFNKYYRSDIEDEILLNCRMSSSKYLKSIDDEIKLEKKLSKYFDTAVYSSLVDFDIKNYHTTDKAWEYVKGMLYPIEKGEKEIEVRRRLLKESGIDIEYNMGFPRLWNHCNIIDYFKEMVRAIKSRKLSNLYLEGFRVNKKIDSNKEQKKKTVKDRKAKEQEKIKQAKMKEDRKNDLIKEKQRKNRIKADKKRAIANKKMKQAREKEKRKEAIAKEKEKQAKIKAGKRRILIREIEKKAKRNINGVAVFLNTVKLKTKNKTNKEKKPKKSFLKKYNKNTIFTAKKGLLDKIRKKVNDKNFKRTLKNLTISSVSSLVIGFGAVALIHNQLTSNDTKSANIETEVAFSDNTNGKTEIKNETVKDKTVKDETVKDEVAKDEKSKSKKTSKKEVKQDGKQITLKDALIDSLEIDFDSQFSMSGTYYETPEETGNYGTFNDKNENLEISFVNVIDEDGTYSSYDENDAMTISEIKMAHPNSTISYHTVSEDGMILGWVKADENDLPKENIEQNLIKGSLRRIKKYLDTDTMRFLCDTELSEEVNSQSKYLKNINKAMKQYKKSLEENERDSR